jgi:hypothetical protein
MGTDILIGGGGRDDYTADPGDELRNVERSFTNCYGS